MVPVDDHGQVLAVGQGQGGSKWKTLLLPGALSARPACENGRLSLPQGKIQAGIAQIGNWEGGCDPRTLQSRRCGHLCMPDQGNI